ncbi:hypothetical protein [Zhenhengia yiwuensis]|uniref:hypothetical protein n=1 Tax=Zhenhengia yiwuensis TaxID=2763666 RepID=UPI002A7502BF|nr:hypothetical protein [Zhenhengia yiwuensis]MDY3369036.1 hypothetical protein [Zhenhengia yiwuensis]
MRGEYRRIDKIYGYEIDDEQYSRDKHYIDEDDYTSRLNDIETDVQEIEEKLENVQGIDLIDNVKEMLNKLADKLY